MTNSTATVPLKGYPNFYVSRTYFEALNEASKFIQEHFQDKVFPEQDFMDIIKKALGPMPTINGSLTSNEINAIQLQYHKAEDLFLKRVIVFSR